MSELRIVQLADIMDMPGETQDFAAASDLVIELRYDGVRAGLIGFIPYDGFTYLWMVKEAVVEKHKLSFARIARKIVDCYKGKYGLIKGHSDVASCRWLQFLGADVGLPRDNVVEFTIRG